MEANHHNSRAAIVSLLRGFFACPTIAALAQGGMTDRMLQGSFAVDDFPLVTNTRGLLSLFHYLQALGLLVRIEDAEKFQLTPQGRTIIKRSGAFLLLSSYREYFANLSSLLVGQERTLSVDRRQNVEGTGALHSRKFFPVVWEMLGSLPPRSLIDIGCGDGQFLEHACLKWRELNVAAVDLSAVAVEATTERLRRIGRSESIGIVQNGARIDRWIPHVPETIKSARPLVLSMWFVVHEFSEGNPKIVCHFFHELNQILPHAEVVLGEITALPSNVLAENHEASIMPELLLFHALSRQGVLSWEAWQALLQQIPYELAAEHRFDNVNAPDGSSLPSSFVWYLKPQPRTASAQW